MNCSICNLNFNTLARYVKHQSDVQDESVDLEMHTPGSEEELVKTFEKRILYLVLTLQTVFYIHLRRLLSLLSRF